MGPERVMQDLPAEVLQPRYSILELPGYLEDRNLAFGKRYYLSRPRVSGGTRLANCYLERTESPDFNVITLFEGSLNRSYEVGDDFRRLLPGQTCLGSNFLDYIGFGHTSSRFRISPRLPNLDHFQITCQGKTYPWRFIKKGDSALFAARAKRRNRKKGKLGTDTYFRKPEIGVLYKHIALADEPLEAQKHDKNDKGGQGKS